MDSVTQFALGASVCYAAIGPTIGKRALIIGGIVGTLPDMDVLVPYEDAVASFTYHRSWSHSLIVLSIISWPLAWLINRITSTTVSATFGQWWWAIWLVLITHPLLDSFTIYGTQIWWPLPVQPVAVGSIFIIDPLYTLPLIFAGIVAWNRSQRRARRYVFAGIIVSTAYLGWTLVSQTITTQRLKGHFHRNGVVGRTIVVAPFPTALLWRTVVTEEEHYFEIFSSLFDDNDIPPALTKFPDARKECEQNYENIADSWAINRLEWFTNGAIAVSRQEDNLVVTDLRMGIENDYVFEFIVGGWVDGKFRQTQSKQLPLEFNFERLSTVVSRIGDQSIIVTNPQKKSTSRTAC